MAINVIGLLNVSIPGQEFIINDRLKLISREYFEKNEISMPSEIRFYKTFIVSEGNFGDSLSCIPDKEKDCVPVYFLWAIRLYITEFDIISSDWFIGDTYQDLKRFMTITTDKAEVPLVFSNNWVDNFKIDNITRNIDSVMLREIADLYTKLVDLYKVQNKQDENINLHWFYAFTKYQESYLQWDLSRLILEITSALEFLLVNTSNESEYRAGLYASLIYADKFKDRMDCYSYLKWAYTLRKKISEGNVLEQKILMDKEYFYENVRKLKNILAIILLKTMGLTNKQIEEKLNKIIFHCPQFK